MITKDTHGLTVNTDKCYEIQVRMVYIQKGFFGGIIKKSKDWSHWQYYKTMAGVLAALKHYQSINYGTIFQKSEYQWDFRPVHKYYDI